MSHTIGFGIYKDLAFEKLSIEYLHGLADMGNKEALKEIEKRFHSPIETQTIGFGKFASKKWVTVDLEYLFWLLETIDPKTMRYTLVQRAIEYIQNHSTTDDFGDVIYVD